jgi:hypothetical protein
MGYLLVKRSGPGLCDVHTVKAPSSVAPIASEA